MTYILFDTKISKAGSTFRINSESQFIRKDRHRVGVSPAKIKGKFSKIGFTGSNTKNQK